MADLKPESRLPRGAVVGREYALAVAAASTGSTRQKARFIVTKSAAISCRSQIAPYATSLAKMLVFRRERLGFL